MLDVTNQLELKDIEVGEETEMLLKELNSLEATKERKQLLNSYSCSCTAFAEKACFGFSKF